MRFNGTLFSLRIYCSSMLLCCLFISIFCSAQKITARVIDLPGSFNRDLLQVARDDEGFIWFGTNEGVWRFDGNDVKLLDYHELDLQQNTAPFHLDCYGNYLVFCLANGEVRFYNKITAKCLLYKLERLVTFIYRTPQGELSFFTSDGQGWKFNPQKLLYKWINLSLVPGWKKDIKVDRTTVDQSGNIYLFLSDRVGQVMKDSIRWGPSLNTPIDNTKKRFVIVTNTAITSKYLAACYREGELIIYDKHTLTPLYTSADQGATYCFSAHDDLVVISWNDAKILNAQSSYFQTENNLLPQNFDVFTSIAGSDANSFLLGTSVGIVELRMHGSSENKYTSQRKMISFFNNKSIRSIYGINNTLYVGSYSGLYACSSDSIRWISAEVIYAIKSLDEERLLMGVEGGTGYALLNLKTGVIADIPKFRAGPDLFTTALYDDGGHWLSGDYFGVHHLLEKKDQWVLDTLLPGTLQGPIRQISRIEKDLFIATQAGLFRVSAENKLQKLYPANGMLRVYCMVGVSDGIWLGTHGNGLVKIDSNGKVLQQIGFNEGLASNFVYSVALLNNQLVAGTGGGVSILDLSTGIMPLPVKKDDNLYGRSSQECNHSAIFRDSARGQVILGGVNGLIFVDQKDYGSHQINTDRLLLSYFKTGGRETNAAKAELFAYSAGKIVLKPDEANIVLKFSVPGNPDQQDGLFRIVGLEDKWQRVKLNQEVNLFALPPGTYTLQARLPFSADNRIWFVKTLVVEPAFYQTMIFKGALLLICLGIIYYFWRSKVKKIQMEAKLRSTIASDLHDDIGSTLQSISVYTEIATQQLRNGEDRTKVLLDKMGIASRNMIDTMSDIVWAIHPKNDHFENVLKRMQFFAGELLSSKNIRLKFETDEKIKKLRFTMQERKNIYLIYKEAVNNAYKYSTADTVTVRLHKSEHHLAMVITDNGGGFDWELRKNIGNGLTSMMNRAKEIGGKLTIGKPDSGGTRISLRLHRF
jgi:two-component sensor histidine kinase